MNANAHDSARDAFIAAACARTGVVVVVGDVDTGKTTFGRQLLAAGLDAGLRLGWIDTDLGQSTVGPPTTLGLREVVGYGDLEGPVVADELYFVGSVTPRGSMLPTVAGVARLLSKARRSADLVVIDTSGFVTGSAAERLKFHLLELAAPVHVVGLQRDGEMEPLLALARHFTGAETHTVPVHPAVVSRSVAQRAVARRDRLARYFSDARQRVIVPLDRCMPTLPSGFPPARLDRLLVGLDNGRGRCLGLGVLQEDGGQLWLRSHTDRPPAGLRLGTTQVDDDWWTQPVDPRALFDG